MEDDRNRTLRRLAKSYRITFKLPSDDWPAAHSSTFKAIKELGDHKFDSYCESVKTRSHEEPWIKERKNRAEWLAQRASRLFGQQRNEAGWRFGLENDVLRRFSVEVACPNCRARVWRSEIEAIVDESGYLAQNLEQRKRNRKSCQCPPETRPQDYYEIGTNPLFDDRTEELIIHDHTLRSELPKQKPDRIYGLQATKNFEDLLSRSMPQTPTRTGPITVRDLVRSSPFKGESDPLLFPFLVLEAKSESSPNGFDDIQTQTAFPIWALLKLQENLQSHVEDDEPCSDPLIWFLASRGDAWRVYGCYLTKGANNEPTRYDIILLWNGSVILRDSALQLILIVDYILDWARDAYRPSILRQLKSIATGKSYDEISVANDSDVFSMRRNISNWIPAPPSTINMLDLDEDLGDVFVALEHQDLLPLNIPNTKYGLVRSALITEFHFISLHVTHRNVSSLLQQAGGPHKTKEDIVKTAREFINFITRWDEMLLLTSTELDKLEQIWTGTMRCENNTTSLPFTEEFYVLLESGCFISSSWEITKEITCLAISRSAFEILVSYANLGRGHQLAERLPDIGRPCKRAVLLECVECLRAGSPWQVLFAAISSTLVSLYPVPERKRAGFTPPVDCLGFGYIRFSRIKPFIRKFLEIRQPKIEEQHLVTCDVHETLRKTLIGRGIQSNPDRRTIDLSFQRVSTKRARNYEEVHDMDSCSRCYRSGQNDLSKRNHTSEKPVALSTHGSMLVESLVEMDYRCSKEGRHDICLFVVENSAILTEEKTLPFVIEDILKSNMLYHTIRHSLSEYIATSPAITWNLPLIYRPPTDEQRVDVMNWCQELLGRPMLDRSQLMNIADIWTHTQMFLHFFSLGSSFLVASVAVTRFYAEHCGRCWSELNQRFPILPVTLQEFYTWIDRENGKERIWINFGPPSPPPQFKLRGDVIMEASKK